MVLISAFGEIEHTVVSEKLGLYISNLRGSEHEDWFDYIVDEFAVGQDVLDRLVPEEPGSSSAQNPGRAHLTREEVERIVGKAICLDFSYEYEDMPLGDYRTNCFDGRLCEGDYAEKLLGFLAFASYDCDMTSLPGFVPSVLYSSNWDGLDYLRASAFLYLGTRNESGANQVKALEDWGSLLDGMLATREDYLLLDYLVQMLWDSRRLGGELGYMSLYSLCQLFLEKDHETELDWKLRPFLPRSFSEEEAGDCAKLLRQIRNKIAHGDFVNLDKKLEEYCKRYMEAQFRFDHSEYSRRNWILGSLDLILSQAVRCMIALLLLDREKLNAIKKMAKG